MGGGTCGTCSRGWEDPPVSSDLCFPSFFPGFPSSVPARFLLPPNGSAHWQRPLAAPISANRRALSARFRLDPTATVPVLSWRAVSESALPPANRLLASSIHPPIHRSGSGSDSDSYSYSHAYIPTRRQDAGAVTCYICRILTTPTCGRCGHQLRLPSCHISAVLWRTVGYE